MDYLRAVFNGLKPDHVLARALEESDGDVDAAVELLLHGPILIESSPRTFMGSAPSSLGASPEQAVPQPRAYGAMVNEPISPPRLRPQRRVSETLTPPARRSRPGTPAPGASPPRRRVISLDTNSEDEEYFTP